MRAFCIVLISLISTPALASSGDGTGIEGIANRIWETLNAIWPFTF